LPSFLWLFKDNFSNIYPVKFWGVIAMKKLTSACKQRWITFVFSVLLALPFGLVGSIILTPLYWWIEKLVPVKLVGHGGPETWVTLTVTFLTASLLYIFCNKLFNRIPDEENTLPADRLVENSKS